MDALVGPSSISSSIGCTIALLLGISKLSDISNIASIASLSSSATSRSCNGFADLFVGYRVDKRVNQLVNVESFFKFHVIPC